MRAYIAGPLFNQGERWFDEQIEAVATRAGLETFLPHRDTGELITENTTYEMVFEEDIKGLDGSSMVIANLNGCAIDDGTAWELGYAYAKGIHLVGVHTDMRSMPIFEGMIVNLMIQASLNKLVRSLDELEAYLKEYLASK